MIATELQILSEALWEASKNDPTFFAPIQSIIKRLAELDYSDLSKENVDLIKLYSGYIENFFSGYRSTGTGLYIPPASASNNQKTVVGINNLVSKLSSMDEASLAAEAAKVKPEPKKASQGGGAVFIGHGRSKLYTQVQLMLQQDCNLKTEVFENESHTGESIVPILEGFLDKSSFAVIVMTAEDETGDGKVRARQNVIHEVGLFQGRLGFTKVMILKQEGVEEFSNLAGLQYIPFSGDIIDQAFYHLQKALKKHGLIK